MYCMYCKFFFLVVFLLPILQVLHISSHANASTVFSSVQVTLSATAGAAPNFLRDVGTLGYSSLVRQGNHLYAGFAGSADGERVFTRWTISENGLVDPLLIDVSFPAGQGVTGSIAVNAAESFLFFGIEDSNRLCKASLNTNAYQCVTPSVSGDQTGLGAGSVMTPAVWLDEASNQVLYQTESFVHVFDYSSGSLVEQPSLRLSTWLTALNSPLFVNSFVDPTLHKLYIQQGSDFRQYDMSSPSFPNGPGAFLNFTGVAGGGTGRTQKSMLRTSAGCWVFLTDYDSGDAHLLKWCPSTNAYSDITLPYPVKNIPVLCEDPQEELLYMVGYSSLITVVAVFDLRSESLMGYGQMPFTYTRAKACYVDATNRRMYIATASQGLAMYSLHWVSSVSPYYANPAGGTLLTVRGRGFRSSQYVACSFGSLGVATTFSNTATFVSSREVQCITPAANFSRMTGSKMSAEVALNGNDFTSNAVQFVYEGLGIATQVSPSSLPLTGTQVVTVKGYGFVDAKQHLMCRFGTSEVVTGTFSSSRAILCFAPSRTRPTTERVFVSYNLGQDWSESSANLTWTGPPVSLTATGSPLFFPYSPSVQINSITVQAVDARGIPVASDPAGPRTIRISQNSGGFSLLPTTPSLIATMTNGLATFSSVRLGITAPGVFSLSLSSSGLRSATLNFEIGKCPTDSNFFPPGFTLMDGSCTPCSLDTFKTTTGSGSCQQCPARTSTLGRVGASSQTDCQCAPGYYSLDGRTNCQPCPTGAICPGGDVLSLQHGYWRSSPFSDQIYPCDDPDSCNSPFDSSARLSMWNDTLYRSSFGPPVLCTEGTTGLLCSVCKDGWVMESDYCSKCPDPSTAKINFFLVISGCILGVALTVRAIMKDVDRSKNVLLFGGTEGPHYVSVFIKILINFMQMNAFALLLPTKWPTLLGGILNAERTSSGPSIQNAFMSCVLGWTTLQESVFLAILPFGLVFGLATFFGLWHMLTSEDEEDEEENGQNGSRRLVGTRRAKSNKKDFFIVSCLVSLFLIHPFLTARAISNFGCDEIGDTVFMISDRLVECGTPEHDTILLASLVTIGLWSIGLPVFSLLFLFYRRKKLDNTAVKRRAGFLYMSFRFGKVAKLKRVEEELFPLNWGPILDKPLSEDTRSQIEALESKKKAVLVQLLSQSDLRSSNTHRISNSSQQRQQPDQMSMMAIGPPLGGVESSTPQQNAGDDDGSSMWKERAGDNLWYFELFVALRKVVFVAGLFILKSSPSVQGHFASWVVLFAIILQVIVKPYQTKIQNILETASLFCTLLTVQGSMFLSSSIFDPSEKLAISIGVSIANLALLAVFPALMLKALVCQFRDAYEMGGRWERVTGKEVWLALVDFFGFQTSSKSFQNFVSSRPRRTDSRFSLQALSIDRMQQSSIISAPSLLHVASAPQQQTPRFSVAAGVGLSDQSSLWASPRGPASSAAPAAQLQEDARHRASSTHSSEGEQRGLLLRGDSDSVRRSSSASTQQQAIPAGSVHALASALFDAPPRRQSTQPEAVIPPAIAPRGTQQQQIETTMPHQEVVVAAQSRPVLDPFYTPRTAKKAPTQKDDSETAVARPLFPSSAAAERTPQIQREQEEEENLLSLLDSQQQHPSAREAPQVEPKPTPRRQLPHIERPSPSENGAVEDPQPMDYYHADANQNGDADNSPQTQTVGEAESERRSEEIAPMHQTVHLEPETNQEDSADWFLADAPSTWDRDQSLPPLPPVPPPLLHSDLETSGQHEQGTTILSKSSALSEIEAIASLPPAPTPRRLRGPGAIRTSNNDLGQRQSPPQEELSAAASPTPSETLEVDPRPPSTNPRGQRRPGPVPGFTPPLPQSPRPDAFTPRIRRVGTGISLPPPTETPTPRAPVAPNLAGILNQMKRDLRDQTSSPRPPSAPSPVQARPLVRRPQPPPGNNQ